MSEKSHSPKVGYKKPPEHSRFKKGVSGNPAGGPKGAKNKPKPLIDRQFEEILLKEAYREVRVVENGESKTLPLMQAGIRALTVKAAKGDIRANVFLSDMVKRTEQAQIKRREKAAAELLEAKYAMEDSIKWAKENKKDPPKFDIHPDDIHVDFITGEAWIEQTVAPEIQAAHDDLLKSIYDYDQEIELLKQHIKHIEDPNELKLYKSELRFVRNKKRVTETIFNRQQGMENAIAWMKKNLGNSKLLPT